MLAFYDLCAVLTPCGPLKALVNLMQEKDSPDMPGLLYEAQLPAGTSRPSARSRNTSARTSRQGSNDESDKSATKSPIARRYNDPSRYDDESAQEQERSVSSASTVKMSSKQQPSVSTSPNRSGQDDNSEPAALLTNGSRAVVPLALARIYRLPLVSHYGASSPRRRGRDPRPRRNTDGDSTTINESPLMADVSPEEFYEREFSTAELLSDVEVEFPESGGRIEKESGGRGKRSAYNVYGRDGELKRTLVINSKGKVYELTEEDDEDDDDSVEEESSSIRLGLVSRVCDLCIIFFCTC